MNKDENKLICYRENEEWKNWKVIFWTARIRFYALSTL
jgi:hypothetical protein